MPRPSLSDEPCLGVWGFFTLLPPPGPGPEPARKAWLCTSPLCWAVFPPFFGSNRHIISCESCLLSWPDATLHVHTAQGEPGSATVKTVF